MTKPFIHDDFLLESRAAKELYHTYAEGQPIIDYHCHLSPKDIAEDRRFENLTQIWLAGDHYKWRAMRTCGVDERYITGEATDWEKFEQWAETVPKTLRNPLYHWTHLELERPFGITDRLLGPEDRAVDLGGVQRDARHAGVFGARHPETNEREGGLHHRRPGRLAGASPGPREGPAAPA